MAVPYAFNNYVTVDRIRKQVMVCRFCPECDKGIMDDVDDVGETITNNYGQHFEDRHPELVVR